MLLVQGDFTPEAEEEAVRTLLGWRPAGMILQSFVQSEAARALLVTSGVAVVEISEIKGRAPIDMAVGVSNFETAYAMTMHLAARATGGSASSRRRSTATTGCSSGAWAITRRCSDLGMAHEDMEVEVTITPQGGAEALAAADRPAPGHRGDLLLVATRWRSARSRNAIGAAGRCPSGSRSPGTATWIWRRSSIRR